MISPTVPPNIAPIINGIIMPSSVKSLFVLQYVHLRQAFQDAVVFFQFHFGYHETAPVFHCPFRIAVFHSDILCSLSFAGSHKSEDEAVLTNSAVYTFLSIHTAYADT